MNILVEELDAVEEFSEENGRFPIADSVQQDLTVRHIAYRIIKRMRPKSNEYRGPSWHAECRRRHTAIMHVRRG